MKTLINKMTPKSIAGQMIFILGISFAVLLTSFAIEEILEDRDDAMDWAESGRTLNRLAHMVPILEKLSPNEYDDFFLLTSSCHSGYAISSSPFSVDGATPETQELRGKIADRLGKGASDVIVGHTIIKEGDFSFGRCRKPENILPIEGVVISVKVEDNKWFHTEVHHHRHTRYMVYWVLRTGAFFLFIGAIAVYFIRRLTRPLDQLTRAAERFGDGLKVSTLDEDGPIDLRRTMQAFNAMQQQVANEVKKRTDTLASISHDIRTPLTALRIKAELIEDDETRQDLIASIDKMEMITASALEYLRGESRGEPKKATDLSVLVESECQDFSEMGYSATFGGKGGINYVCRPEAMSRAIRNLIGNAVKYGGSADVSIDRVNNALEIRVADNGPGIPQELIAKALEPFERLSKARESDKGGFGLGLSVSKAIVEGHDGRLRLEPNEPQGLLAIIELPPED